MSTDSRQPVFVRLLIQRAQQLSRDGRGADSRDLFAAAIAADPTPAARIAFAVDLAAMEPQQAVTELELAWEEARRLQCPMFRTICCRNLATLFRRLGDDHLSARYQQLAIAAEMESGEFATHGTFNSGVLIDVAATWSAAEADGGTAERLLQAAEVIATEAGERAAIATQRGVIAARRRQYAEALRHLLNASRLFQKSGSIVGVAQSLMNIGHVLECQHRFPEARRALQTAASIHEKSANQDAAERARTFGREIAAFERLEANDPCWN